MLFFADKNPQKKKLAIRPKTINEIKKLQNFVKTYKSEPGKSLNEYDTSLNLYLMLDRSRAWQREMKVSMSS